LQAIIIIFAADVKTVVRLVRFSVSVNVDCEVENR